MLTSANLMTTLQAANAFPHSEDKETEAQRGCGTCLPPHAWPGRRQRALEPSYRIPLPATGHVRGEPGFQGTLSTVSMPVITTERATPGSPGPWVMPTQPAPPA